MFATPIGTWLCGSILKPSPMPRNQTEHVHCQRRNHAKALCTFDRACPSSVASTALADIEVRRNGSSWARIEGDGTIRISGSSVGRIENDGTVRKNGSSVGRVENDGTIREHGSSVGRVENDGKIRKTAAALAASKATATSASTVELGTGLELLRRLWQQAHRRGAAGVL